MNHDDSNVYLWDNFLQHPPEVQEKLLAELKSALPNLSWRKQVATFKNAPVEVILAILKDLHPKAQVKVYDDMPVGGLEEAKKLLCYEARVILKMRPRYRCLC